MQGDFIVLTPYRNQATKVRNLLAGPNKDRVMTVHAAQGQEWDAVIFCASDCGREPFLTDSNTIPGNATLNTAISRVKRRLILVLDREYWKDSRHQILSRLIALAQ
jgi:superfamily I DNA/RNA helicase